MAKFKFRYNIDDEPTRSISVEVEDDGDKTWVEIADTAEEVALDKLEKKYPGREIELWEV
tara:strand:- start:89914 stop:90093 length:180 start_codon:yes stop_codon:yes gene_type:complete